MSQRDHDYFASTRVPALFGAGVRRLWPLRNREHAVSAGSTLCGLPSWLVGDPPRPIVTMRHPFRPNRADSCRRCSELVDALPTTRGSYEQLHDTLLTTTEPGAERDGLLSALRRGVRFELRMGGQARQVVRQYGELDRLLAGRPAAEELADSPIMVDLIRLTDGERAYLMVRPHGGQHAHPADAPSLTRDRRLKRTVRCVGRGPTGHANVERIAARTWRPLPGMPSQRSCRQRSPSGVVHVLIGHGRTVAAMAEFHRPHGSPFPRLSIGERRPQETAPQHGLLPDLRRPQ